jgi:hypothetical protein
LGSSAVICSDSALAVQFQKKESYEYRAILNSFKFGNGLLLLNNVFKNHFGDELE